MAFSRTAAFDLLARALRQGRLAHAYLLAGPDGAGKRWLAAALAQLAVGGRPGVPGDETGGGFAHPDIHVAEPESKLRRIVIDQVRALEKALQLRPAVAPRKVGVILEADRLQPQAANAFLKTLEEPPGDALLLLVTARPEQLLDTVRSRCIPVRLHRAGHPAPTADQRRLLDELAACAAVPRPGLAEALLFARRFLNLLGELRARIAAEHDAEFERDRKKYQQTTGNSAWLEEREAHLKAAAEAAYLRERFLLVDTLLEFWSDVARTAAGGGRPAFAGTAAAVAEFAGRLSRREVLRRIDRLETLRDHFNRPMNEQLAVEAAFLDLFSERGRAPS